MLLMTILLLLVPAVLLVEIWRKRRHGRFAWTLHAGLSAAYITLIFLAGRWDFFSYWLRFVPPAALIILAAAAWRAQPAAGSASDGVGRRLGLAFDGLLLLLFVCGAVWAVRGRLNPGPAVELGFPLRAAGGSYYYVGGGGSTRIVNNHQAHPGQQFALDIVGLNRWGARTSTPFPEALDDYVIFGDTVVSPCTGTVLAAVDGLRDHVPPARDTVRLAGNHVLLACGDARILLAHLMEGSVRSVAGERVRAGQPLGRVGNSGNTTQPHLHIHAARGGTRTGILNGTGVPMTFCGRFLVRNRIIGADDRCVPAGDP